MCQPWLMLSLRQVQNINQRDERAVGGRVARVFVRGIKREEPFERDFSMGCPGKRQIMPVRRRRKAAWMSR
jgi:hypothetical protein